MAAAVADYTPAAGLRRTKIDKGDGPLTLTLVRTPDILAELGRGRRGARVPVLVGFAAETGRPRPRARQKLAAKRVDLIVANDVSASDAGFDVETNAAVLISPGEEVETPLLLKTWSRGGDPRQASNRCSPRACRRDPAEPRSRRDRYPPSARRSSAVLRELGVAGVSRDSRWRRRATDAGVLVTAVPMTQPTQADPLIQIARSSSDALAAIRDDIGDLHAVQAAHAGRRQIVFGVGNPVPT